MASSARAPRSRDVGIRSQAPLFPLRSHLQRAVGDGKRAATALTNAALTQLHLPALQLGLLGDAPGLRPAAAAKLQAQQDASLAALALCLQQLQGVVASLADAAASLQQLLDAEAAAPLLGEGAVFAALPLRLLGGMLAEVRGLTAGVAITRRASGLSICAFLTISCVSQNLAKRGFSLCLLQVHAQHRNELAVKAGVVQGCHQIVGE